MMNDSLENTHFIDLSSEKSNNFGLFEGRKFCEGNFLGVLTNQLTSGKEKRGEQEKEPVLNEATLTITEHDCP